MWQTYLENSGLRTVLEGQAKRRIVTGIFDEDKIILVFPIMPNFIPVEHSLLGVEKK